MELDDNGVPCFDEVEARKFSKQICTQDREELASALGQDFVDGIDREGKLLFENLLVYCASSLRRYRDAGASESAINDDIEDLLKRMIGALQVLTTGWRFRSQTAPETEQLYRSWTLAVDPEDLQQFRESFIAEMHERLKFPQQVP